jgi:uncharacterized membrane protein
MKLKIFLLIFGEINRCLPTKQNDEGFSLKNKRLLFIDLLRGWALLVMIEVHVFNAFLKPEIKLQSWFGYLNFINGLVAPSFLFISGFAFMIASQRKLEDFRKFGYAFWRQIGRILLIWGVGYSLHIPFLSLHKMQTRVIDEMWRQFFAVDVLQCIAFGLLLMFVIRLLIKSDKIYNIIIVILGIISAVVAPFIEHIDFSLFLSKPVAAYLNSFNGSLFPLFPWLGFMLAGGIASSLYAKAKEGNYEEKYLKQVMYGSFIVLVISYILLYVPAIGDFKPSPVFFLERLAIVLLLMIGLRYYELRRKTEKSFVLDVGRESLLIYWLHLQVIYRKFWDDKSMENIVNFSMNVLEAIGSTLLLAFLMVITAKIWGAFKKRYQKISQYIVTAVVVGVIAYFFLM